jgi:endonuclease/exonuclease/phosphatase family metal-dependent hydrolase
VRTRLPPLLLACLLAAACTGDAGADRAAGGLELEVMSLNLRWGPDPEPHDWPSRRPLVAALLRDEAPDVVGLQESRAEYLDELLPQLPAYAAYPLDGERQNTILYRSERFRLDAATSDAENDRSDAPEQDWGPGSVRLPRCARLVERRSGAGFYVFNNHFDHRYAPSRAWSAATLIDRIRARTRADPVILTGDFNAGEHDAAIRYLLGQAPLEAGGALNPIPFVDTFRARHPDDWLAGTYHRFLGVRFGPRVDYVFVRPGTRVLAARILSDRDHAGDLSDHFAVSATIELPPRPSP